MRHDIHLNEQVFSPKKVAEEVVMQHPSKVWPHLE
jgi:hypothetical protein